MTPDLKDDVKNIKKLMSDGFTFSEAAHFVANGNCWKELKLQRYIMDSEEIKKELQNEL